MLVCAFLDAHCTRDRGCSAHPVFPAPLISRARFPAKLRAHGAARMLLAVIVREGGRSSIPETSVMDSISHGVLDPPHARGMTVLDGTTTVYLLPRLDP